MHARALILDRDGVVNVDTAYLHRVEDCQFIPGIFDLVRTFKARGFAIAIATNQSGIGRGLYSEADYHAFMAWMEARFQAEGAALDAVRFCPYHPTQGVGVYRRDSNWRKPASGMFLDLIRALNLDPTQSWAVGDKPGDITAALGAGLGHKVLLKLGAPKVERRLDYWIVPHLAAVEVLLKG